MDQGTCTMPFSGRYLVISIAAVALLSGCGDSEEALQKKAKDLAYSACHAKHRDMIQLGGDLGPDTVNEANTKVKHYVISRGLYDGSYFGRRDPRKLGTCRVTVDNGNVTSVD